MKDAVFSPADATTLDLLRLHLATLYHGGMGPLLVELFGGAGAALRQPAERLRQVPGMTPATLRKLLASETARLAERELKVTRQESIRILAWGSAGYPTALQLLPQMPLLLFARGQVEPARAADLGTTPPGGRAGFLSTGVVGARRPTPYGLNQARRFAGVLARHGITIVSGLARGIDGEAHSAALDAGGRTLAVLGSGMGRIYPREHRQLAGRIIEEGRGALLSEFPFEAPPRSFHFPMRNRLLSGLSAAVLVVEASERSGSLITVHHALEQGKSVYVVPGRVDRPEAMGCLRLLREGAAPAIDPSDVILDLLGELPGNGGETEETNARDRRRSRLDAENPGAAIGLPLGGRLGPALDRLFTREDAWHPDQIAADLGLPAGEVLSEISRLEMEGRLRRLPGGFYVKR